MVLTANKDGCELGTAGMFHLACCYSIKDAFDLAFDLDDLVPSGFEMPI